MNVEREWEKLQEHLLEGEAADPRRCFLAGLLCMMSAVVNKKLTDRDVMDISEQIQAGFLRECCSITNQEFSDGHAETI